MYLVSLQPDGSVRDVFAVGGYVDPGVQTYPISEADFQALRASGEHWRFRYQGGRLAPNTAAINAQEAASTRARFVSAVQAHIDSTARGRGYDSAVSCLTYLDSTVAKWAAEAQTMRSWRDQVWQAVVAHEAAVQAGTKPLGTPQELVASLPPIGWPA